MVTGGRAKKHDAGMRGGAAKGRRRTVLLSAESGESGRQHFFLLQGKKSNDARSPPEVHQPPHRGVRAQGDLPPGGRHGKIIYNLSLIESPPDLEFALSIMKEAHKRGITISDRLLVAGPGGAGRRLHRAGRPARHLHGVQYHARRPSSPARHPGEPDRGGGIVEVDERVAQRFTSLILYRDTTLDPLEVLISQEPRRSSTL